MSRLLSALFVVLFALPVFAAESDVQTLQAENAMLKSAAKKNAAELDRLRGENAGLAAEIEKLHKEVAGLRGNEYQKTPQTGPAVQTVTPKTITLADLAALAKAMEQPDVTAVRADQLKNSVVGCLVTITGTVLNVRARGEDKCDLTLQTESSEKIRWEIADGLSATRKKTREVPCVIYTSTLELSSTLGAKYTKGQTAVVKVKIKTFHESHYLRDKSQGALGVSWNCTITGVVVE